MNSEQQIKHLESELQLTKDKLVQTLVKLDQEQSKVRDLNDLIQSQESRIDRYKKAYNAIQRQFKATA